jgi:hypothetical protein
MSKRFFISIICFSFLSVSYAQTKEIKIGFSAHYDNQVISIQDSSFKTKDASQLEIETLKFYASNFQLLDKGKIVLVEKNSVHLIDLNKKSPFQFIIRNKSKLVFDQVKFDLGIDSTTNVSGALGGDLDPTKGMYWTWQSGYINFKLEGKSLACKTRNNEFQFHLGGYQSPNYGLQQVTLSTNPTETIDIKLDLSKLLQTIDLSKTNQIMSPTVEAVSISKLVAQAFYIAN